MRLSFDGKWAVYDDCASHGLVTEMSCTKLAPAAGGGRRMVAVIGSILDVDGDVKENIRIASGCA